MEKRSVAGLFLIIGVSLVTWGSAAPGNPLPGAQRCPVFPANNPWNQRVDGLPVHPRSDAIMRSIGLSEGLHPDFGSGKWNGGPIGIPYTVVTGDQPRVPVKFNYERESDPGPYPIPPGAPIEGGRNSSGDRHVIVVDKGACRLYELFDARSVEEGSSWTAGSGATWDLTSNALRPKFFTSADAAGLPTLPGLARYSGVRQGTIDHALRFTVARTRRAFIYPARHFASNLTSRSLPAMGQRFRLKKRFDVSAYSRQSRVILRTLKRFGMIVADNGSDWFISGVPHSGWNNNALHELNSVVGRHFEVVDASSLRPH